MSDPYASHLAVIAGLKPKPKKVLEFGSGLHSTKAFLGMRSVTRLVSVERDPAWRSKVEKKLKDKRLELLGDGDEVPSLEEFDLVFIDDGADGHPEQRIQTIAFVLAQKHPRVVVHDANYRPYLDSIHAFSTDVKLHADDHPWTAVVAPS